MRRRSVGPVRDQLLNAICADSAAAVRVDSVVVDHKTNVHRITPKSCRNPFPGLSLQRR
jgi:hypothetical protein